MRTKIITLTITLVWLMLGQALDVSAQEFPSPSPAPSPNCTKLRTCPSPSPSPSPTPTPTPTPIPTPTPSPSASPSPLPSPTKKATPKPTHSPSPTPSSSPSPTPELVIAQDSNPLILPLQNNRSAFVRSVLAPNEIPIDPLAVILSAIAAGLTVLLILFPAELFNSTVQSNYDEIITWLIIRKLRKIYEKVNRSHPLVLLVIFAGIGALINSLLSSDFGFNKATLSLVLGLLMAMFVISFVYDVARSFYMRKRFSQKSKLRAHSLGLFVGIILVAMSRVANFVPGYCYGIFTALVFKDNIDDARNGEGLAFGAIGLIIVALLGWFAWIPIKAAATAGDPSLLILAIDAGFASLWVSMLTSTVFGLLPMRFMYGETIKNWNPKVWALTYFTGVFLFIYTILNPAVTIYSNSDQVWWVAVAVLFVSFGTFSMLFWGYFRYRYLWSGNSSN